MVTKSEKNGTTDGSASITSTSTRSYATTLDLSALDGIRCIACLSIVLFHTHFFYGALFFPLQSRCMEKIANLPFLIGPLFFNLTAHMTIFWVISGFLCEYQLDKLVHRKKKTTEGLTYVDYGRFLLNRLLRLYPLYLLFTLLVYTINGQDDRIDGPKCDDLGKVVESLFFVLRSEAEPYPSTVCAGVGWSVMVDVHGYLAIIFFHMSFSERFRRKWILPVWYLLTAVYMTYITWNIVEQYDLISWKNFWKLFDGERFTLEHSLQLTLDSVELESGVDVRSLWLNYYQLDTPYWQQMRDLYKEHVYSIYFSSIHKHGSAMLLGSLLYLNRKNRACASQGESMTCLQVYFWAAAKILVALTILYGANYSYIFSGIPAYLIVDAALSLSSQKHQQSGEKPNSSHSILAMATRMLSFSNNPLWSAMAPYTYGIYMVHIIPLVALSVPVYRERASKMGASLIEEVCNDYSIGFILTMFVKAWLISWMVAIILFYTVEWPFRFLRKQYLFRSTSPTIMSSRETNTKID